MTSPAGSTRSARPFPSDRHPQPGAAGVGHRCGGGGSHFGVCRRRAEPAGLGRPDFAVGRGWRGLAVGFAVLGARCWPLRCRRRRGRCTAFGGAGGGCCCCWCWPRPDMPRRARRRAPARRRGFRSGGAFWLIAGCAALAVVDALQRLGAGSALRVLAVAAIGGGIAALAVAGTFDALSIVREYATPPPPFRRGAVAPRRPRRRIGRAGAGDRLSAGARRGPGSARARAAVCGAQHAADDPIDRHLRASDRAACRRWPQPFRSLPHSASAASAPAPAVIALVLYALLPIVRNTAAGLAGVDPGRGRSGARDGADAASDLLADRAAAGSAGIAGRAAHRRRADDRARGRRGPDRRRRARHLCFRRARPVCARSGAARRVAGDLPGARRRFSAADPRRPAGPGDAPDDRTRPRHQALRRPPGRRRSLARHPRRRVLRVARLVRLRQIDDFADDQPAGRGRCRHDPGRRRGRDAGSRPKRCGAASATRSSRPGSFRTGLSRTTSPPSRACSNGRRLASARA